MISTTTPLRGMSLVIQNNSAHPIRCGDSPSVSVTTPTAVNGGTAGFGLLVQSGGSSGGAFATSGAFNLKQFYIAGTSTDVIDWEYIEEE
jgi:hypothetical protein